MNTGSKTEQDSTLVAEIDFIVGKAKNNYYDGDGIRYCYSVSNKNCFSNLIQW